MNLNILFEDNAIIVVVKPAGVASQEERGFEASLIDGIRGHLVKERGIKGIPYVGVVHRLDKPVGGVMVYAKTKEAAAELSRQIGAKEMKKCYYALLSKIPAAPEGTLVDYLVQDKKNHSSSVAGPNTKDAKRAELAYRIVKTVEQNGNPLALADVELMTGRHHQIRVQFAHLGCPLYGDTKYNPERKTTAQATGCRGRQATVGLYAYSLSFCHPKTGERMTFQQSPAGGIWDCI